MEIFINQRGKIIHHTFKLVLSPRQQTSISGQKYLNPPFCAILSDPGFNNLILLKVKFLFESLRIQKTTPLIRAAKKHHTEVRYCLKKIAVTRHDNVINMPNIQVLLIPETKRGVIVTIR
jgi:hypothetical protein